MSPNDVYDGESFEDYVQQIFASEDIRALTTPTTNDYGADLIVKFSGHTIAIQCKYYSSPVGIKAVQEVMGSLRYYAAEYGAVITNSTYTQQAQNLAHTNNILLIDGSRFQESFKEILDSFISSSTIKNNNTEQLKTDLTMEDLVIRYGISKNTILRKYLSDGLPYTKVGREYRFNEAELKKWELNRGGRIYKDTAIGLTGFLEYANAKRKEIQEAEQAKDWEKYRVLKKELKQFGYTDSRDTAWMWLVVFIAALVGFLGLVSYSLSMLGK